MSKSGLFAHFGSKEELQISTVRAAAAIFVQRVVRAAEERYEPGLARLHAMLDSWLDYMEPALRRRLLLRRRDGRDGRPARAGARRRRGADEPLGRAAGRVRARRDRARRARADTDPEQLAFELDALGTAVNSGWQLHEDDAVFERGRRALPAGSRRTRPRPAARCWQRTSARSLRTCRSPTTPTAPAAACC